MAERIVDAPPVIGNPWWDPVFDQWPGYFNDPSPYYTPDYNAPFDPLPPEQPPVAAPPTPPPAPSPEPIDEAPPVIGTKPAPAPAPAPAPTPLPVAPVLPIFSDYNAPTDPLASLAAIPNPGRPTRRTPRRRRTAPSRRSRPVRPTRTLPPSTPRTLPPSFPRPRPGDPAVPRFLTNALRGIARLFTLVGGILIPLPAGPREFDEDYGQPHLFAPGDNDRDRRRDDDVNFVRDDFSDLRAAPVDPLATVDVTGVRPRPINPPALDLPGFASPDLRFDPFGDRSLEPFPDADLFAGPGLDVVAGPSLAPEPINAPSPLAPPAPAPGPDIALDPFPAPAPAPAPRPSPRPGPDLNIPQYFGPPGTGAPLDPIIGHVIPMPDPGPFPQPELDKCNCPKKKSKKKKPREKCYRGSYIEKRSSLSKSPKEEVPCQ